MNLTREMILSEIQDFEVRIQMAKDKLAALPVEPSSWKERKERKKQQVLRRELKNEINHVYRLISMAENAL